MLFMVIEHYKDPSAVYTRFHEKGRMLPSGRLYIGNWVDADLSRCFQVMKTYDLRLLKEWISRWDDIVDFEIVRVLSSEEAQNVMAINGPMGSSKNK